MHTITVDTTNAVLEVTLAGTMTPTEVDAYMTDLRRTMIRHGLAGDYGIVIDVTACTIQTQEMITAMGSRMAAMPAARAIAIVAVSQLARLQIKRLFTQDYARIVASVAEGRVWAGRREGARRRSSNPADGAMA